MKKYHTIYKTTNTVNNKIYVGLHSTNRVNDRYLGSGWVLKDAISKYGKDKFTKDILYVFDTRGDARAMEARIVDKEFISRKDTYNLAIGGMGVEDQTGSKNHMFGKTALNAKKVQAVHLDGRVIVTESIRELSEAIGIARGNVRRLLKTGKIGRRGWVVTPIEDIV